MTRVQTSCCRCSARAKTFFEGLLFFRYELDWAGAEDACVSPRIIKVKENVQRTAVPSPPKQELKIAWIRAWDGELNTLIQKSWTEELMAHPVNKIHFQHKIPEHHLLGLKLN